MHYPNFTPPTPYAGLIGHRGISAQAPENSLSSFKLAALQSIAWVEFDLRLTKDHNLVIFHDDTLERTTNGKGFVHECTLSELSSLDAGSWFGAGYHNEKIPVFLEILPELINLNLYMNIELKMPPEASQDHAQNLIRQLEKVLKTQWPHQHPWPLISSFHWELLKDIRIHFPEIPIGFLQDECTSELIETTANIPNAAVHCHYQSLTSELLALSQDLSVPILTYTVNSRSEATRLLKEGIFGIFSDDPLDLLEKGAHTQAIA